MKQQFKLFLNNVFEIQLVDGTPYTIDGYDLQFAIVKTNGFYEIYETHTGLRASTKSFKTQKQAKEHFEKMVKTSKFAQECLQDIKNRPSVEETEQKYINFFELRDEFKKITNITMPILLFYPSPDVVALDKLLFVPDGISLKDFLTKKFGKRAGEIVQEMLEVK